MHLWPSLRIRDSFKTGYLKKLDFNINKMNSQKESQKKLLDNNNNNQRGGDVNETGESSNDKKVPGFILVCRELLMLASCCYCCFCCGACVEQEEN